MAPDSNILISLSEFSVVLSVIFCIAVKAHVTRDDEREQPRRTTRTAAYVWWILSLSIIPVVFHPDNGRLLIFSNSVFMMLLPEFFTKFIKCFFRGDISFAWRAAALRTVYWLAFLWICFFSDTPTWSLCIAGVAGIGETCYLLYHLIPILRRLREYDRGHYSSPEDFPHRFIVEFLLVFCVTLGTMDILFFVRGPLAFALRDTVLVAHNLAVLIFSILPGEKFLGAHKSASDAVSCQCVTGEDTKSALSADALARIDKIKEQIEDVVERKRGFLDPHLSLDSIVSQIDCGKTYASSVCKNELGGFYNYVNGLRVQYADDYAKTHPFATQDEIAENSGFSSRQTLASARKKLKQNGQI